MGGGDLNLKKSWHPHTMKNQEKVWKAEKAKTQEDEKLKDLRREIEEEKNREELTRVGRESGVLKGSNDGDKKLDWMYKSASELINREEYLLGRKIDKSFEILQAEEKAKEQQNLVGVKQPLNHVEHECVPFSIRSYKNFENSEQVDLQRKAMEDPLMLIKQREMETRRKLLENPVKLKELHRILKTDKKLRKASKNIKKSKKSKKKHKKRKHSSSSDSSVCDSDSELDSKLAKKLKSGLLNKDEGSILGLNLNKLLDTKFEKISQELDKAAGNNRKRSKKKKPKISDSDSSYEADRRNNHKNRRSRSLSEHKNRSNKRQRPRSISRDKEKKSIKSDQILLTRTFSDAKQSCSFRSSRSKDNNRHSSKTKEQKNIKIDRDIRVKKGINRKESSPSKEYLYTDEPNRRSRSNSTSRKKTYKFIPKSPAQSSSRTQYNRFQKQVEKYKSTGRQSNKLTEEEKQAKIKEMMTNASWREDERTEVVRKHREDCAREEDDYAAREFDKDFLNKQVKKAMANQTSVSSRLRANLNNIQRTSAAMSSNFARK